MTLELARKRRNQSDLIHELVEALERSADELHRRALCDWPFEECQKVRCEESRAVLEKAKLLDDRDDCIPLEDAAEAAASQERW